MRVGSASSSVEVVSSPYRDNGHRLLQVPVIASYATLYPGNPYSPIATAKGRQVRRMPSHLKVLPQFHEQKELYASSIIVAGSTPLLCTKPGTLSLLYDFASWDLEICF